MEENVEANHLGPVRILRIDEKYYRGWLPDWVPCRQQDQLRNVDELRIWLWNLIEYDRIVYLDTDSLVMANVEDLFRREYRLVAARYWYHSVRVANMMNNGVL